jgi:phosphohistidine phosphatase
MFAALYLRLFSRNIYVIYFTGGYILNAYRKLKTLYLVRHAKSGWSIQDQTDIDRPLSERGYKDAHLVSEYLYKKKVAPSIIISSPAVRAMSTALIFAETLHYSREAIVIKDDLYETDRKEYLSILQALDDEHPSAMIFAHNPIITETAHYLSDKPVEDMPTCCLVALSFNTPSWQFIAKRTGSFQFLLSPSVIK